MAYRVLVDAILVAHFAFLAYLLLGGFLAWRWRWAFWPHLAAAGWGLLIITFPVTCPLTWAETWAREHAGQGPVTRSFIDRYLTGVLYPARYADQMRYLVAAVLLGSWLGGYLRYRRNRARLVGAGGEATGTGAQRASSTSPPTTARASNASRKATPS